MSPTVPPRLMSRAQTAQWLGVSVATLDRMTRDGRLRPVRIGGRVLYDPLTLHALVASGGVGHRTERDQG